MKTKAEAHEALDRWMTEDHVGNLTYFRAPHSDMVDCVSESTIKVREMDSRTAEAFSTLMGRFPNASKGEFFRNAKMEPDRIKVVAPFDAGS
jgi:hypothetical protein